MRSRILLPCLIALASLQSPLVAAQSMPGNSGFTFAGGDGSTLRKAVVVNGALTAEQGLAAELEWIRRNLPGATVQSQGRITGPPHYDVVTVKLASGALMDLHFDITAFHGK